METLIIATFLILLSPNLRGGYAPAFTKYDRIIKEHLDRFQVKQKGGLMAPHSNHVLTESNAVNGTEQTDRSYYYEKTNGAEYLIPYGLDMEERDGTLWDSLQLNGDKINDLKLQDVVKINQSSPVVVEQAYKLMIVNVTYCHECNYWYGVKEILNAQVRISTKDLIIAMKAVETDCKVNTNVEEIFKGGCSSRSPVLYCNGYINLTDRKKHQVKCQPFDYIKRFILTGYVKVEE